ncbi:DUF6798 domain-containing protein [Crateriforma conspicua]|uniref:DUF6798 domain-containing protein n=1 Tax=Crateriforma conspicua TaxID=2527996 RepID=A0A5C5Y9J2_9PLAN|nr:DUF6798 domain-containing protein [Crateriforma conspicua]QDV61400.1 hypothetical protein Mal65_05230 [Crateriforma conspicua]TWT72347.1 hypothetical protein Pan14r_46670 [Crateriforma conspicua]
MAAKLKNVPTRSVDDSPFRWAVDGSEWLLLTLLIFGFSGDLPPMVNEAHYLVKAKNFWNPDWCSGDLFAASGKAHATYYWVFGWLTKFFSLEATAWIARWIGWALLAAGLQRLCRAVFGRPWFAWTVLVLWAVGIERANLAGEWVFGGTEAKIPAYGLLLFGITAMMRQQWNRCWIFMGASSAFHVLVGGWSVLSAMLVWGLTQRPIWHRPLASMPLPVPRIFQPGLFAGGLIALAGLVPALWLTIDQPQELSVQAAKIYVYVRLPHHLLSSSFPAHWFTRHLGLIAITAVMTWIYDRLLRFSKGNQSHANGVIRRLSIFTSGTVLIALAGWLVDVMPWLGSDFKASLLRYYWFRMTDVMVPLQLGVATTGVLVSSLRASEGAGGAMIGLRRPATLTALILITIAIVLATETTYRRVALGVPPSASNRLLGYDPHAPIHVQRKVFADWLKVCDFIRYSTDTDEVFLTPRHQQTFKWYAQRAEVVNFKDVPQDAESLIQWEDRFRDVFPQRLGTMRVTIQYAKLREYRRKYGVRYMLVDRRVCGQHLPLVQVYPRDPETNGTYAIYELPPL